MKQPTLTISESTTIAQPIADVFRALIEPQHAKHWISLVFDADQVEPGPIVAGTSAWYMVKLFGRRIRIEGKWLRYEAPFESVFASTVSPLQIEVTYRCRSVADGTHVEITAAFGNGGILGVTTGMIQPVMSISFQHDLTLLKTYMEQTPTFIKCSSNS